MLRTQLRLSCTASQLLVVVAVVSLAQCDAFQCFRSKNVGLLSPPKTNRGCVDESRLLGRQSSLSKDLDGVYLFMAKPNKNSNVDNNDGSTPPSDYKFQIEDGSPLVISIVVLGFGLLQVLGDGVDKELVDQYAAPAIICSASLAAGISRLVRNRGGGSSKKNKAP